MEWLKSCWYSLKSGWRDLSPYSRWDVERHARLDGSLENSVPQPEDASAPWYLGAMKEHFDNIVRGIGGAYQEQDAPLHSREAVVATNKKVAERESREAEGGYEKACQYFEKSVQLNPTNLDAQSDLLEYYLEAPGFLGGGLDKAAATAAHMASISPADGQWAEAKVAEKRKESGSAEAHLRRAVELAPQQVGKLIELARFLMKQGRYQEADQSFERAEKVAPNSPRLMFARAETYVKARHNVNLAKELLKRYMNMELNVDDPPKSEAAKLLRQVQGD